MEKATFGAGCFWGVEENFRNLPGVSATKVGYSGGTLDHAFDPSAITYKDLVKFFFEMHDPTTLNRQGPDRGDQYRSAIFFHSPEQEAAAREVMDSLQKQDRFRSQPIVTQLEAAKPFWDAEEYHQKYLAKQGIQACH